MNEVKIFYEKTKIALRSSIKLKSSCWNCSKILENSNSSTEHILLNSCGGRIRSKNLLCQSCNIQLGKQFDAHLARQLNNLSVLFNISKDGKSNRPKIEGLVDPDGIGYRIIPGEKLMPELEKPNIIICERDDQLDFSLKVRNMDELIDKIVEIKKKYPFIDVIEALKNSNEANEYLGKPLDFNFDIGGLNTYKSILKTAINYYMFNGGTRDTIYDPIADLNPTQTKNRFVWFHYPNKEEPIPEQLCHNLYLRGVKESKILYCYVEYFETYSFLVKLSTEYIGEDILKTYSFDLLSNKEVPSRIHSKLSRSEIEKIFLELKSPPELKDSWDRTAEIANKLQKKAKRKPDITTIAVKLLLNIVHKEPEHRAIANLHLKDTINLIKQQIVDKINQT